MKMFDKVNYAIMNAFFSRPVEEQNFNTSPVDNEDLAKAAITALLEPTEDLKKFTINDDLFDWDNCNCHYCGGHKFAVQAYLKQSLLDK